MRARFAMFLLAGLLVGCHSLDDDAAAYNNNPQNAADGGPPEGELGDGPEEYYEMDDGTGAAPKGRPYHFLDDIWGGEGGPADESGKAPPPPPDGLPNGMFDLNIDGANIRVEGAFGMEGADSKQWEAMKKLIIEKLQSGALGGMHSPATVHSVKANPCDNGCNRDGGALLTIVGTGLVGPKIVLEAEASTNNYDCAPMDESTTTNVVCLLPPARGADTFLDVVIIIKGRKDIVVGKAVRYAVLPPPPTAQPIGDAPPIEDLTNYEAVGIGGLAKELDELRRRVLVMRQPANKALLRRLGIRPVRGVLLYGPPGTGKTLVARKVAALVNAKATKIVNGPELVSKYIGDSEALVRGLFKEALADHKSLGERAGLHVIILDELDAMLRPRGSSDESGARAAYDSITTQFLALMDGFDSAPNVLLIGLTNRIGALDPALLRPGRFEVRIRLPVPNAEGRHEIIRVHTKTLREGGYLSPAVDLPALGRKMMGFTGADVEGTVRAAIAMALERVPFEVTASDLEAAIAETLSDRNRPGNSFVAFMSRGIVAYGPGVAEMSSAFERNVARMLQSPKGGTTRVLLEGPAGSGVTAMAAYLASLADMPYVRFITAASVLGLSAEEKLRRIVEAMEEARDAPSGLVVLDTLEQLVEYAAFGGRFNTVLLHELTVLMGSMATAKSTGGKGPGKVMVLATTHNVDALETIGMGGVWDTRLRIAAMTRGEHVALLTSLSVFESPEDATEAARRLPPRIGPKRLMFLVDAARAGAGIVSPVVPQNNLAAPYATATADGGATKELAPMTASQFHETLKEFNAWNDHDE